MLSASFWGRMRIRPDMTVPISRYACGPAEATDNSVFALHGNPVFGTAIGVM
jgi:hypothetical protein